MKRMLKTVLSALPLCFVSAASVAQQVCPDNLEEQIISMSGPVIAVAKGQCVMDNTMTIQDQASGCRLRISKLAAESDPTVDPNDDGQDVCPVGTEIVAHGGVLLRADHTQENDGTFDYEFTPHGGSSVTLCPSNGG